MSEVMELKFKPHHMDDERGFCELTDEMDKYLIGGKTDLYHTYILDFGDRKKEYYDRKEGHVYVMRVPGATRGQMITDAEGRIEILDFYEDSCYKKLHCYDIKMEEIKEKYIGRLVKKVEA